LKNRIRGLLREFYADNHPGISLPDDLPLTVPRDPAHGDLSSNICMVTAGKLGTSPRELSGQLVSWLEEQLPGTTIEVAGPGFLNFHLPREQIQEVLRRIIMEGEAYGRRPPGSGERINLEYVSANPTGPAVVVSARAAAFGSTLARLLEFAGHQVTREYYLNDSGAQVTALGGSLRARYRELQGEPLEIPENGYHGTYLGDMAGELDRSLVQQWEALGEQDSVAAYADYAVEKIKVQLDREMNRFGSPFDIWFSEKSLHESGQVDQVLEIFEGKGLIYENEGARWFRSTDFGDDKDRVVVRSDGRPTYFLADAAYHLNKLQRGFTKAINVLGPDHHSHVTRMQAIAQAIGAPEGWLQILLLQWVTLVDDGKVVPMSKRAGEFVTMADLIDDVGVDVARTYFLTRRRDSHLEFDLTLAREQSSKSRVFYAQYATARIAGVLRKAATAGVTVPEIGEVDLSLLTGSEELELIKQLEQYGESVISAAEAREPNRLFNYLGDLTTLFHKFYHECQIVSDDLALSRARLSLVQAVRQVLRGGLGLMGVDAPERM
jgi:arginyl-tRNA synthetase